MKKFIKKSLVASAALIGVLSLGACSKNSSDNADDDEEDLGFNEVTIFEGETAAFLNVNAVYFQAVSMTDGKSASDSDCHLELDVSAGKNDFGYGVGDWVPYLTVSYSVTKDTFTQSGTFMPMAASDGPHYGANIKLDGNGTYKLSFTITFPDTTSTYLLHTDNTGPEGHAFPAAVTIGPYNWNYKSGAWNE